MQKDMFELDLQVKQMNNNNVDPDTVRTTVCWVSKVTCKVSCGCNLSTVCTPGCPF